MYKVTQIVGLFTLLPLFISCKVNVDPHDSQVQFPCNIQDDCIDGYICVDIGDMSYCVEKQSSDSCGLDCFDGTSCVIEASKSKCDYSHADPSQCYDSMDCENNNHTCVHNTETNRGECWQVCNCDEKGTTKGCQDVTMREDGFKLYQGSCAIDPLEQICNITCPTGQECFVRNGEPFCDTPCESDSECTGEIAWPDTSTSDGNSFSYFCNSGDCTCISAMTLYDNGPQNKGICRQSCQDASSYCNMGLPCESAVKQEGENQTELICEDICRTRCQDPNDTTTNPCILPDAYRATPLCIESCGNDSHCDNQTAYIFIPTADTEAVEFISFECGDGGCSCVYDPLDMMLTSQVCLPNCDPEETNACQNIHSAFSCGNSSSLNGDRNVCAVNDPCQLENCNASDVCNVYQGVPLCEFNCSQDSDCNDNNLSFPSFDIYGSPVTLPCGENGGMCSCVKNVNHDPATGVCRLTCDALYDSQYSFGFSVNTQPACVSVPKADNSGDVLVSMNTCFNNPCGADAECIPGASNDASGNYYHCVDRCYNYSDCTSGNYYVESAINPGIYELQDCSTRAEGCECAEYQFKGGPTVTSCLPACTLPDTTSACSSISAELSCISGNVWSSNSSLLTSNFCLEDPCLYAGCGSMQTCKIVNNYPHCIDTCNSNYECESNSYMTYLHPNGAFAQADCTQSTIDCYCVDGPEADGNKYCRVGGCTAADISTCENVYSGYDPLYCLSSVDSDSNSQFVCSFEPAPCTTACNPGQHCNNGVCEDGCEMLNDCLGYTFFNGVNNLTCSDTLDLATLRILCNCYDDGNGSPGTCMAECDPNTQNYDDYCAYYGTATAKCLYGDEWINGTSGAQRLFCLEP